MTDEKLTHFPRLLLILLVLLFTVPFLKKPFHIDDVYFIEVSRNIMKTPLDPFSGAVSLLDSDYETFRQLHKTPNTFEAMSHPPLVPYYMCLITSLAGGTPEPAYHLAFLVFPLLCAFSMYSLAKRFAAFPLAATVFFLCSPAFVVNSHNVMTDVPMLALFLTALALFISGTDHEDRRKLVLAGVFAGLAMLTRYVAVLLIPLFIAYAVVLRKKWSHVFLPCLAAGTIFGVWCLQNLAYHHELHVIASARYYAVYYGNYSFQSKDFLAKTVGDLAGLGGTEIFSILFLLLLFTKTRGLLLCFVSLMFSWLLVVVNPFRMESLNSYTSSEKSLLAFFLALGILSVLLVLGPEAPRAASEHEPDDRRERRFLVVWLLITLAGAIFVLPFGTVRYMIPVLPPMVLLAARQVGIRSRAVRASAMVALALTFVFGLVLGAADFQFADAYKKMAAQSAPGNSSRRWFIGEWGFRYYMEENGSAYLLSTDNSPVRGDVIVKPQIASLHGFSPALQPRIQLRETQDSYSSLPICLLNPAVKAGFYAHGFGFLPFAFCSTPIERFDIYDVVR